MKITKRQLKRIIREEKAKLAEYGDYTRDALEPRFPRPDKEKELYVNLTDDQSAALDELEKALAACLKTGVSNAEINDTVESSLIGRQLGKR